MDMTLLKCLVSRLAAWWLLAIIVAPTSVLASTVVAGVNVSNDLMIIMYGLALVSGGLTATLVHTAVDQKLPFSPLITKPFVGFFFSLFATTWIASKWPSISLVELLFPAYSLAIVGAPIVVYSVGILLILLDDKEIRQLIINRVKILFGAGVK